MSLPNKIYELSSFQREFKNLLQKSVGSVFANVAEANKFTDIDWNYLLLCASVLSHSSNGDHQDVALRIAQSCVTDQSADDIQKSGAAVIFHNLTNDPALKLAVQKDLLPVNFKEDLPLPFRIEQTKRDLEHIVYLKSGDVHYLNKFQRVFYDSIQNINYVSASAPTSAGKSFALNLFVTEKLSDPTPVEIIYIVPTRALISQVERDFTQIKAEQSLNVYISSVPQAPDFIDPSSSILFIFTQERLHWFLNSNPQFVADYLIVDEAQKISDGSRGILLQQKIEDLVEVSPNIKILFCSASTENPGVLLSNLSEQHSSKEVVADYVSVNQNLIWVSHSFRNLKVWNVKLCYREEDIELGKISLQKSLINERDKLPTFAHIMGSKEGGNMIYVNTQSEAEKTSEILFILLGEESDCESDPDIKELITLTKSLVHPHYVLSNVLKRGIAFHYGNMPLLLKDEIETLFLSGKIKYLICTSTLLEGVNLPAKSIFLKNPGRGNGNPMTENDFWNLAGRAGRSTKEFQGNIICIDPEVWKPPRIRTKYKIHRALSYVSHSESGLLDYIGSDFESVKNNRDFDYALSYYYAKFLKKGYVHDVSLDPDFVEKINAEMQNIKERIEIPDEIIHRNPGINPLRLQKLFEFFQNYEDDILKLIPVFPDSNSNTNPAEHYRRIINVIEETLSAEFSTSGLNHYRAILVVNWMRGYPLGRIIDSNLKYWQEKKKLSAVIRETMQDIEEYVRFQFAKSSSCYTDVLKFYLQQNHLDLVDRVPELNIWIEFGVSQKTQISLISLGLSRHTAIEFSKYAPNRNLTREECVKWIKKEDLSILELAEPLKKEIAKIRKSLV